MISDEIIEGTAAKPTLHTLADKMSWLIDRARPAGRGPYTNAELAAMIEQATEEQVRSPLSGSCGMGRRPTRRRSCSRHSRGPRRASWLLLR